MSGSIQDSIYLGYAAAAGALGQPHQLFRPVGSTGPTAPERLVASLPATFSPDNSKYRQASGYGKPVWTVLVDGRLTRVGDYLVGPSGTFFVSAMESLLPIQAIQCNANGDFKRPSAAGRGGGKQRYGGDVAATETDLMTGWPIAFTQGTKGEQGDVKLPGDVRQPWFAVLVPAVPGLEIQTDDVLLVGEHRYKISSTELSDKGWRLTAMLAEA